jgi:RimJ/RimL family protein N-acetyltransferase
LSLQVIYGHDEALARWACGRIPWCDYHPHMRAVGVADGADADAQLLAVVFFSDYRPGTTINGAEWYNTVECGIAASSPRWASRRIIKEILSIPFKQFRVRKVRLIVPSTNKRALRFAEGIGFTPEGTLRHEYAKGVHACVLGLLRHEFERPDFLGRKPVRKRRQQTHGQQQGWRGIGNPAN